MRNRYDGTGRYRGMRYDAEFDGGHERERGRGWFSAGDMVEGPWGGAHSRGDSEYQGRRLRAAGGVSRPTPGWHSREYDRGYRRGYDDAFRADERGWRAMPRPRPEPRRGYDRGW